MKKHGLMRRTFDWIERMVDPFAAFPDETPPASVWRYFIGHLRPFRKVMAIAAVIGSVVAAMELGLIWYAGRLVDLMAAGPATFWGAHGGELIAAALVLLLLRPLAVGFNAIVLFSGISTNMLPQVKWRAHKHMLGQSVGFFQSDFAGRLANRVINIGPAVEDTAFLLFEAFWQAAAFAIATLILLSGMTPWLSVPLALWIAAFIVFILWFAPKAGVRAEKHSRARSRFTGRVVDAYTNIESVKLFAHAEREEAYGQSALRRHRLRFGALMRIFAVQQGAMAAFNSAAMLMVIAPALWLWSAGTLSIGEVAAAVAMSLRLNTMTGWIMWMTVRTFEHIGTMRESLESIAVPHAISDRPDAPDLRVTQGAISIRGLSHHYGKGAGGLDGVSLEIRAGERVGLVGPSGAGKSSLVNLLLRMRDAEAGEILIDGQNVAHVTQDSLRGAIGMVTQDSSLLHRSIRANILYGRPDATEDDMRRAARMAEAEGFIDTLRDPEGRRGYDVMVGERGVKLSGGQRQRVALARVILKDAPILLLDEATSALDSEVEAAIQSTLYDMMEGKTVIAIAHRLSTIARMDRIIVMDKGRIVEDGSHGQLLDRGGLYARLWARQSGGFLGEDTGEEDAA